MTSQIEIRNIEETDSSRIAELNQELGYPTSSSLVARQLRTIQSEKSHHGFVAISKEQIVGYIHGFISIRLTTEPFAEIGGLIVDQRFRKKGIGKKLVKHLEQQIRDIEKVRVRCNVKRSSAHEFYMALDYHETKEQKVFQRNLLATKPNLNPEKR